jgi:hypothetical protein
MKSNKLRRVQTKYYKTMRRRGQGIRQREAAGIWPTQVQMRMRCDRNRNRNRCENETEINASLEAVEELRSGR